MKIHDCFDETAFAPLVLGGILIVEKWIYIVFLVLQLHILDDNISNNARYNNVIGNGEDLTQA